MSKEKIIVNVRPGQVIRKAESGRIFHVICLAYNSRTMQELVVIAPGEDTESMEGAIVIGLADLAERYEFSQENGKDDGHGEGEASSEAGGSGYESSPEPIPEKVMIIKSTGP